MSETHPQVAARCWTQEQISFFSDVIATGTVQKTTSLQDASLSSERAPLCGVEITFAVSQLFKGKIPSEAAIVVRSLLPLTNAGALEHGAYLLYLTQDGPSRFQPTSGFEQAALSIRRDFRAQPLAAQGATVERREPAHFPVPMATTPRPSLDLVAA